MPVLRKPYRIVNGGRSSKGVFYLADCLDLFAELPAESVRGMMDASQHAIAPAL